MDQEILSSLTAERLDELAKNCDNVADQREAQAVVKTEWRHDDSASLLFAEAAGQRQIAAVLRAIAKAEWKMRAEYRAWSGKECGFQGTAAGDVAFVREQLAALGVPTVKIDRVAPDSAAVPFTPADQATLEREIEDRGDQLMLAFGFEVVRLSQRRASKVTAGLPDRRYYHRDRRLSCWWEAKTLEGEQRPDQRAFQAMVEAVGEIYLLGAHTVLRDWLVAEGLATWDGQRLEAAMAGA